MVKIKCSKCNGKGILSHLMAYANGTCFQCKGVGYKTMSESKYKKDVAEAKRMEKAQREYEENRTNWKAEIKRGATLKDLHSGENWEVVGIDGEAYKCRIVGGKKIVYIGYELAEHPKVYKVI